MRKQYEEPVIEFIELAEDVITSSTCPTETLCDEG